MGVLTRNYHQVIAAEATNKGGLENTYADMLGIASAIYNRAMATGLSANSIVANRNEFNSYMKSMPPGTAGNIDLAQKAWDQVVEQGPVHNGMFFAMPSAVSNLPKGLQPTGYEVTGGHQYFSDPLGRAIAVKGGKVVGVDLSKVPQGPTSMDVPVPETRPMSPLDVAAGLQTPPGSEMLSQVPPSIDPAAAPYSAQLAAQSFDTARFGSPSLTGDPLMDAAINLENLSPNIPNANLIAAAPITAVQSQTFTPESVAQQQRAAEMQARLSEYAAPPSVDVQKSSRLGAVPDVAGAPAMTATTFDRLTDPDAFSAAAQQAMQPMGNETLGGYFDLASVLSGNPDAGAYLSSAMDDAARAAMSSSSQTGFLNPSVPTPTARPSLSEAAPISAAPADYQPGINAPMIDMPSGAQLNNGMLSYAPSPAFANPAPASNVATGAQFDPMSPVENNFDLASVVGPGSQFDWGGAVATAENAVAPVESKYPGYEPVKEMPGWYAKPGSLSRVKLDDVAPTPLGTTLTTASAVPASVPAVDEGLPAVGPVPAVRPATSLPPAPAITATATPPASITTAMPSATATVPAISATTPATDVAEVDPSVESSLTGPAAVYNPVTNSYEERSAVTQTEDEGTSYDPGAGLDTSSLPAADDQATVVGKVEPGLSGVTPDPSPDAEPARQAKFTGILQALASILTGNPNATTLDGGAAPVDFGVGSQGVYSIWGGAAPAGSTAVANNGATVQANGDGSVTYTNKYGVTEVHSPDGSVSSVW